MDKCSFLNCFDDATSGGRCNTHKIVLFDSAPRCDEHNCFLPAIKGVYCDLHYNANNITHPTFEKTFERVEYVRKLRVDGVWTRQNSAKFRKELMEAWGVSASTITNYSVEATRALNEATRDNAWEHARAAVDSLVRVVNAPWDKAGDRAATVAAANALLKMAGIDQPESDKVQKHAHLVGSVDGQLSPADARAHMGKLFNAKKIGEEE